MAKRKSALAGINFNKVDPLGLSTGQPGAAAGVVGHYHIEAMLPDPHQPRALLPEALAMQVTSGQMPPQQAVLAWEQMAEEAGPNAPVAYLLGKMQELAESIATHGLINPITIHPCADDDPAADDIEYRIVTGERRWWAHVYLAAKGRAIQEGNEQVSPLQIKATLTPEGAKIRAHQLVENWFREDISVVEKAYGLWALRCELSGLPFGNYADAELVNWQDVEALLNIGRRQRRRIVAVLELSEQAQALINGHRLSERAVRPVVARLGDHPDLQLAALRQLTARIAAGEDYGTREITALVDSLLARRAGDVRSTRPALATQVMIKKFRSRVRSALKLMTDLDESDWGEVTGAVVTDDEMATELRRLREAIDKILPDR